jgi:hypothetical protein
MFKIVYCAGIEGQIHDALTRIPGGIPLKWGAENTLQLMLKTENLDIEMHKILVAVFV